MCLFHNSFKFEFCLTFLVVVEKLQTALNKNKKGGLLKFQCIYNFGDLW